MDLGAGRASGATPSWAQLVGRMAAAQGCGSARGEMRYRDPDLHDRREARTGTVRFWYATPNRWRLEDDAGVRLVQGPEHSYHRDEKGRLQRRSPEVLYGYDLTHPARLFDATDIVTGVGGFDGFVPAGAPVPVEAIGRAAWEVRLEPPPHKAHGATIVVDDATGVVLRLAAEGVGALAEMTSFEPGVDVDPARFEWDGPYATDVEDELTRMRARNAWLQSQRFPVPRWWPTGPRVHAHDGDPDTGAFSLHLEVDGDPWLSRWPLGGTPTQGLAEGSAERHLHRWSDARWEWALVVDRALSEEDLRRVVDSIPPDEDHPS
ncbi:hypothetical protein [Actinotalea ferrariae]|nr:hypothetical protein [Actinotalea ferrariae]